jgi:hypothetical protein
VHFYFLFYYRQAAVCVDVVREKREVKDDTFVRPSPGRVGAKYLHVYDFTGPGQRARGVQYTPPQQGSKPCHNENSRSYALRLVPYTQDVACALSPLLKARFRQVV